MLRFANFTRHRMTRTRGNGSTITFDARHGVSKARHPIEVSEVERSLEEFARSLDRSVPTLLDECMVPGAGVALIQKGQIIHKKGYGFADSKKKTPVSVDTGFNIGSVSKTVAAWGLLKLVEDGKVELDEPAWRYVKSWKLPNSEFNIENYEKSIELNPANDNGRKMLEKLRKHRSER